jgi:predicted ester cyclase
MSEPGASRIVFAPAVSALVTAEGPAGDLARAWLRYTKAVLGEDGIQFVDVTAPDVCCIDLELFGVPPGVASIQTFRDALNLVLPDERYTVVEMILLPQQGIVETLLHCTATHSTLLLGVPASGRLLSWEMRTLARFVDGKLALRWDRIDLADFIAQLRGDR